MLLAKLDRQKILPVLVLESQEQALPLAECMLEFDFRVLEITLRTANALDIIHLLHERYPELTLGAGTVLCATQLKQAAQAGADFAVSPGATEALLMAGGQSEINFIPGVMTPSEVMRAREYGFRFQKFFPAGVAGGVAMLKAMSGPLSELNFCPTGGISLNNMRDYLQLGNVPVAGGTWLAPSNCIRQRDWEAIRQNLALLQQHLDEFRT
ncbi:bifunctional 4-hydroxy-2-oxoglutarate aldolase/2-dehydro-3-deoxy-phosphogluconate aldolase [Oceanospirillum sediminis]|uniref:Bifunctional 4-hydroxy-2-oxoglutarate aldolase/2-dehydro-3-deoxy-phosphogluconate aldolase n=1 Tax=Oceanospirillum sediminis TaxID=2760088 RepID=A0A839ILK1_9GAMM|nr:bifunctional 4-hydroxy-2-oxoglutarate aldolase/2-dehydro-3-deoxy-phosphogluconate aldolase [Oceanospirillum sediminis]MBB1486283.1 bifunctional 4-hydroxy-2-oxoglutarate aldolase/2-dehydro-3-deoxy-phosphogluconate aldolase [Oceanospirillum sediminis]